MKKIFLIVLIYLTALNVDAQDFNQSNYGITYTRNFAAQINYDPQIPEDGKFQWNTLPAFGVGAFYEQFIGKGISVLVQGAFQVKGYREFAQTTHSFASNSIRGFGYSNRFRYATLELNPTYYFSEHENIKPFFTVGLNGNYLINTQIESDALYYPASKYSNFNRWSMGYNLASGIAINNLLIFEGKFQRDITPILNTTNLKIWNCVWSLNFKLNINQIIIDTKS